MPIVENIDKSKVIAHEKRRLHRSEVMLPFDKIVALAIPDGSVEDAEAERVIIRLNNAEVQKAIEDAESVDEIRTALNAL